MNTIVTGGAGFIGSHLVDRLLAEGHRVTVIDNLCAGRRQNVDHNAANRKFSLLQADVADHAAIAPYFKDVQWVFHLAALADIVPSIQKPFDYHHSNVDGTISVLEAARQAGVQKFLYAASSSCYGLPDSFPTPETAAIRPQYPYALTKNVGEQYVMHWGQVYKLPVVALRLFNVYGPRSRTSGAYGAVFGVFLAQKLAGKPFTIVGDGSQVRDFTFVSDVVEAFVAAAKSDVAQEIMNVGSGGPASVNRLVELLGGPGCSATHIPKRPGEPDRTEADISKIRRVLGWQPKVPIEEGVKILIENIDYWRQAPVWTPDSIAEATKDWFKYLTPTEAGR